MITKTSCLRDQELTDNQNLGVCETIGPVKPRAFMSRDHKMLATRVSDVREAKLKV